MKEQCRICGGELCGNQRRWIFHPASRLSLQLLLSHALGREVLRDGGGEFACSKCAFVLERMYRFDTVIARVEALSVGRVQRLLEEKERLRQHVAGLYRRSNSAVLGERPTDPPGYASLLQEDLARSVLEFWAGHGDQAPEGVRQPCHSTEAPCHRLRRCRGCAALRVADSDYEAVCGTPRRATRSLSCGPTARFSARALAGGCGDERRTPEEVTLEGTRSRSTSGESLDMVVDRDQTPSADREARQDEQEDLTEPAGTTSPRSEPEVVLGLHRHYLYRPVRSSRGSRLPVLFKPGSSEGGTKDPHVKLGSDEPLDLRDLRARRVQLGSGLELSALEEPWQDAYMPFRFQEQALIQEQQSQLNQYECATAQCVSELQKAQLQVRSLQARTQENEATNERLQAKLRETEAELQRMRREARQRECAVQGPSDAMQTGAPEGAESSQVRQLSVELQALQGSLFSAQLELQDNRRAREQSDRRANDLAYAQDRLCGDLQGAAQHTEAVERQNQELGSALQQARLALQEKEGQLREREAQAQMDIQARDRTIHALRLSLQKKVQQLQEYAELLDNGRESGGSRDARLDKLKERIRDRDRALESAIDEKFRCLEEKEEEVQKLHTALREKDRDLERLRCVVSSNEETITSLDGVLRTKQLELERVTEASRSLQWLKQEAEEQQKLSLTETQALVSQLQAALETRSKEAEELTATLLSKVSVSKDAVAEELRRRLQLRERLFQEVLSDRCRLSEDHHAEVQELLRTISARDQYIQDQATRLGHMVSQGGAEVQELRRQLMASQGQAQEATRLRDRLREKEAYIQELIENQEQLIVTSSQGEAVWDSRGRDSEAPKDLRALQEELHLALKKEKGAQLEISALRAALAKGLEGTPCQSASLGTPSLNMHAKDTFMKLVSEYRALNEALRTETEVYHNLTKSQSQKDGQEKMQTLHMELKTVQALRGQLEGVLTRTQNTALELEKAVKMQPDFGGGEQQSLELCEE